MHYKKAIGLAPKDYRVWNDAGYSYYLQGRWADAERSLKSAERLAPEEPRIKTNLGLVLAAAGRPDAALPLLSQFSGDAIGHANLGYLLAATGQADLASAIPSGPRPATQSGPGPPRPRPPRPGRQRTANGLGHAPVAQDPAVPPSQSSSRDDGVLQTSAQRPRIPQPRQFSPSLPPIPSRSLP